MQIGTKVVLNSGGPVMTVIGCIPSGTELVCVWMNDSDGNPSNLSIEAHTFAPALLTVVP